MKGGLVKTEEVKLSKHLKPASGADTGSPAEARCKLKRLPWWGQYFNEEGSL
jgi:hypothetical protein